MIAAGGPNDREVRYVIKIAADPGNAAVIARESATLQAFEQRMSHAGASSGSMFANRFSGGNGGGGGSAAAEIAHRSRHGAAVGTAAYGFQRMSMIGRERFAGAQQEAAGRAAWAAGLANMVKDSERETVTQAAKAGAATGKAWRAGFFGELAHIAGQRSTIEMATGQNFLGRSMAAMMQVGGRAIGGAGMGYAAMGVGAALGGLSAAQYLSGYNGPGSIPNASGSKLLSAGESVFGAFPTYLGRSLGILGDDDYLISPRLPGSATYASNQRAAERASKMVGADRFRAFRGLWEAENNSIAGARTSATFDAAMARARVTGDFSGVDTDVGSTRDQFNRASGSGVGPAAARYVEALERESQLIRENASARETLAQKMGDEISRMNQLKTSTSTIAERYLGAGSAERALINRAASGDLATMSDRQLLKAGNLGYNSPAYLAEAERRARSQGFQPTELDKSRREAEMSASRFKEKFEAEVGQSLGPLEDAFGKAGEVIGEIVAKKLAENAEAMAEAVQKALDARAAGNVNKGQAMLRRNQQVGLA